MGLSVRVRALVAVAAAVSLAGAASGEPAVVVSPAPEDLAVTIYGDDLALVREKRTVALPAGPAVVAFRGVSDSIVPRAAIVEGLAGLVERNFDYDVLAPHALVRAAVGQRVTLVRTNPGTGVTGREVATLASGERGVVLDFGDGRIEPLECSGLPEGLVFEEVPRGLAVEPTLSVRVHSERAGVQALTLVYLAHRLSWQADYNAELAPSGDRLDLEAWITLANESGTTFGEAQAAVVAGELNREADGDEIVPLERLASHCWAWERRAPPEEVVPTERRQGSLEAMAPGVEEIIVTARKREEVDVAEATREQLLDYHLYRIPWRTTVAAQQSKQVRFLEKRGIRVESFYSFADWYHVEPEASEPEPQPAASFLRFHNRERDGLGDPLPEGVVHVTQATAAGDPLLVGEAHIPNTAEDLPVELEIGEAIEVQDRVTVTDYRERISLWSQLRDDPVARVRARIEHEITNAKGAAVTVEVRHVGWRVRISESSHPWKKDRGYPMWRLEVPAGSSVVLRYRVRAIE